MGIPIPIHNFSASDVDSVSFACDRGTMVELFVEKSVSGHYSAGGIPVQLSQRHEQKRKMREP